MIGECVTKQLFEPSRNQVRDQVWDQVLDQVLDQLWGQVRQ